MQRVATTLATLALAAHGLTLRGATAAEQPMGDGEDGFMFPNRIANFTQRCIRICDERGDESGDCKDCYEELSWLREASGVMPGDDF